jgi:CheY-like chemotaxis protein
MAGVNRRQTILFVEREVVPRNIIRIFLQKNYDVLIAANGDEALATSREYKGAIDILLGDVELRGQGSLPLHTLIAAERPEIRLLAIGTDSDETFHGETEPFLRKPFQLASLRDKLRELSENPGVLLVVDGDPVRRERIRQILIGDYSVLTASSTAEGAAIKNGMSGIDLVVDSELISHLTHPFTAAALRSRVRRLLQNSK